MRALWLAALCVLSLGGTALTQPAAPDEPVVELDEPAGWPIRAGIGARLQGAIPMLLAELRVAQLALGAEAGYSSGRALFLDTRFEVDALFSGAYAKLYLPLGELPVSLYAGAGVVGAAVRTELVAAQSEVVNTFHTVGLALFGGLELAVSGVPVAVFGDFRIQPMGALTVTVGDRTLAVPLGIAGLSVNFGLRLDVSLGELI